MEPPQRRPRSTPSAEQLRQAIAPRLTAADSFGVAKDRARSLTWHKQLRTADDPPPETMPAEEEVQPPAEREWRPLSQIPVEKQPHEDAMDVRQSWFDRARAFRRRMRDQIVAFRRNRGLTRIAPEAREHMTENWRQVAIDDGDIQQSATASAQARHGRGWMWLAFLLLIAALAWTARVLILTG